MHPKTQTFLVVCIAALGGILYGYDLGIIGIALLYLDKCFTMSESQVGLLAASVMIGSLASSVVGGCLSDWLGRKKAMMAAALIFGLSTIMIVASSSFTPLLLGRILQGLSAGMIGVVVPIFMTECAPAKIRGLSSTMFQLCICGGYSISMLAGRHYQAAAEQAIQAAAGNATQILAIQDHAWRGMFSTAVYPSVIFFVVALLVFESPRWLFRRGKEQKALDNLRLTRDQAQAELEIREMRELATVATTEKAAGQGSIFKRHYLIPLVLAITLMSINQATGINSVLPFAAKMLSQSGLTELKAGALATDLTIYLLFPTIAGVLLIDRLGRKNLLKIGTGIIIVALAIGAATYWTIERDRQDITGQLRQQVAGNTLTLPVASLKPAAIKPIQVTVQYTYDGQEHNILVRSDSEKPAIAITPDEKSPVAKLEIVRAKLCDAPSPMLGWIIFGCLILYITGFCFGPGVCLWVLSAEMLPTRVRSLGMGIGVLGNAGVSAAFTYLFLPIVGNFGYAAMWAIWGVCTLAYFLFAAFALPETRGKTLEEIESGFVKHSSAPGVND